MSLCRQRNMFNKAEKVVGQTRRSCAYCSQNSDRRVITYKWGVRVLSRMQRESQGWVSGQGKNQVRGAAITMALNPIGRLMPSTRTLNSSRLAFLEMLFPLSLLCLLSYCTALNSEGTVALLVRCWLYDQFTALHEILVKTSGLDVALLLWPNLITNFDDVLQD